MEECVPNSTAHNQFVSLRKIELWSEVTHMFVLISYFYPATCCPKDDGSGCYAYVCDYLYLSTRVGYFSCWFSPARYAQVSDPILHSSTRPYGAMSLERGPLSPYLPRFPKRKKKGKKTKQNRYTGKSQKLRPQKEETEVARGPVPPTRGNLRFHLPPLLLPRGIVTI